MSTRMESSEWSRSFSEVFRRPAMLPVIDIIAVMPWRQNGKMVGIPTKWKGSWPMPDATRRNANAVIATGH